MIPFDCPPEILLVFLFLLGAVLGSFLNVCIHRIPQHERFADQLCGLWSPASCCPRCGRSIWRRDNLPVVGWLLVRGRCRFCKGRISPRYPLIELFNGLLFVVVYWFEVPFDYTATIRDSGLYTTLGPQGIPGSSWLSPVAVLNWRYAYHMVLLESLVVATFVDFDRRIIPDGCTLPAMLVGLVGGVGIGRVHLVPVWFEYRSLVQAHNIVVPEWIAQYPHLHGLAVSAAGLLVGGGIVWIVRLVGQWVLKQEAMGFGDVVLMAAIGSFLGWQPTIVIFFIAPLCALLVAVGMLVVRREREIPYGPYLSLGTLILLLGWPRIWPIAERIFAMGWLVVMVGGFGVLLLALCLLLVQIGKYLAGVPLYPAEYVAEWRPADQLSYLAGEKVDPQQGRWRTEQWPGALAGRGMVMERQWKSGCCHQQQASRARSVD